MKKNRKPTRLKDFNYSDNGAYFITLCTKDKKCILSSIVGDGALDVPLIALSEFGDTVKNEIIKMNNIYDNLCVKQYVIMPNHVHLLLIVSNTDTNGTSRAPSPTNSFVSKYVSTLKRMTNKHFGYDIWQRSYYDHIIRNEEDYIYHLQYIEENPRKWIIGKDKYFALP